MNWYQPAMIIGFILIITSFLIGITADSKYIDWLSKFMYILIWICFIIFGIGTIFTMFNCNNGSPQCY